MIRNQADIDRLLTRGLTERASGARGDLLAEILHAARTTPQGPARGWGLAMRSPALVGAVAVAAIAVSAYLVWRSLAPSVGTESPVPAASQTPAASQPISYTDLAAGTTYAASAFSEPFHAIVPAFDATLDLSRVAVASQPGAGVLRIAMGCCWNTFLLDDQVVLADVCDAAVGTLPDIPATPQAVGEWLRSSTGLTVSDPIEIPVDGRTALRFDVVVARRFRMPRGRR